MKLNFGIWAVPGMDLMTSLVYLFLSLFLMSAAKKHDEQINQVQNHNFFIIKLEWNGDCPNDVDLYVQDPTKDIIYFRNKTSPTLVLEHDDTGSNSNTVRLPNGEVVQSAFNEEQVDIRGIIPGEYIVNAHMYKKYDSAPTKITVSLFRISGNSVMLVHDKIITLKNDGDELTAFRFTLSKDGDVYDINELQHLFVGYEVKGKNQAEQ